MLKFFQTIGTNFMIYVESKQVQTFVHFPLHMVLYAHSYLAWNLDMLKQSYVIMYICTLCRAIITPQTYKSFSCLSHLLLGIVVRTMISWFKARILAAWYCWGNEILTSR